jgi:hypothetical protein
MSIQVHRYRTTSVTVTTVCAHLLAVQKRFAPQSKVAPEFFPDGAKRRGREADVSPPYRTEFKNA